MYFDNVEFDETNHSYRIDNQILTPSTKWVSQFEHPFDTDEIASRKAEREGLDVDELKNEWKQKGAVALEKGTRVHNFIDAYLRGKRGDGPIIPEINAWYKFWNEHWARLHPVYIEFKIGDSDYKIGGTVDLVVYSTKTNLFHILDWKTGNEFTVDSKYNQNMKAPFEEYDQCKLVTYSMQLSLYKLIIRKNTPLPLGHSMIVYLSPDGTYHSYTSLDFTEKIEGLLLNTKSTPYGRGDGPRLLING